MAGELTSEVPSPRISVCVPSVRADTIGDTIAALLKQTFEAWELVVVVQGDTPELDAVVRAAAERDARVRSIRTARRGASHARNAGVAAARADVVAFTDDDCEPTPTWLAAIDAALAADPTVGVVAGVLEAPPGVEGAMTFCPSVAQRDVTFRPTPEDRELPAGTGFASANVAIRRWAWEAVGPFDEALGPGAEFPSSEDLDLWIRIAHAGVPIRFASDAVVLHTHGARTGWRAVLRMSTAYAAGQGAVAAKLELGGGDTSWRRAMWDQCILTPAKSLRLHQIPARLPRLVAFERARLRCKRSFTLDERGLLQRRDPA